MTAPPNERSRPVSGAAFPESFGGDTHSLPSTADSPWCHTDEHGLPDARCWSAMLDQHRRGYLAGWTEAHAQRDAQEAAQEAAVHALAARTALDHLEVMQARQRAAARWSA